MDFRIYRDDTGRWHWSLGDGAALFLASPRAYESEDACRNGIAMLRQAVLAAGTIRQAGRVPAAG